jgi:hypothetical protein
MAEERIGMDRFFEISNAISSTSNGFQHHLVEKCNNIFLNNLLIAFIQLSNI